MDAAAVLDHIQTTYAGIEVVSTADAHFIFYDPAHDIPHDKRQPFVTIIMRDDYEGSLLQRPGVFRLNIGVARATYRAMFGPEPAWSPVGKPVDTGHDFSMLDTFLPHPVYAPMSWICVLNPSAATQARAMGLIDEAYALAKQRHAKRPDV